MHEKEADEIARQNIAQYSLAHAKKKGVLTTAPPKAEKPIVAYDEMDENTEKMWDKAWTAEEEAKFAHQREITPMERVGEVSTGSTGATGIVGRNVDS